MLKEKFLNRSCIYSIFSLVLSILSIYLWYKSMELTSEVWYMPVELSVILYVAHIFCLIKAIKLKENILLLIISLVISIYNLLLVLITIYFFFIGIKY
ncbi:hypothetical protein EDC24_1357 [Aquisalibacillus elongatus]|uniref:Uncharacterized protein n=1 Tax=Aquisalibacillus elongatus TaxID=485577 RepID=A0A3N5C766_9BACI|nr:hypothetical protein EDC24_1357 [Aquisalibacillus elongatus]